MDKILIKVYIPVLEKIYDVKVPAYKKIYNVIKLLTKAISEINDNNYYFSKSPLMYDKITGIKFDLEKTIKESNIKNGTEVILI